MNARHALRDRFSLEQRVVILTGAAGLYGRGLARDLVAAGARAIAAARNRAGLEALQRELAGEGLELAAVVPFDQGNADSIRALVARVSEQFGQIDGLVNNAVWRPTYGPGTSFEHWEQSMRVNAAGLAALHETVGAAMAGRGSGSIVNIGSTQGSVGPTLSLYRESGQAMPPADYWFHKGGMVNLTRYYAGLFGPKGVRVNTVAPGGLRVAQPAEFVRRYAAETFLGRMGNDQDLGGPVVFLLSNAASYVTGATLAVDGGYTAH
jgi:NAD(P)-dependent dehydrogenase (short-subunit alcohol dehydrogenase family)